MELTKLEKIRYLKFWLCHPFAKLEYRYPPGCGYVLYAISANGKCKKDITDYEFMISHA